ACAAALGEYRYGAGRDAARLLVATVGTGVGAGMVFDGAVFRTSQGCLGDPGHVIVAPDGPRCGCGGRGCREVMAAPPAMALRTALHDYGMPFLTRNLTLTTAPLTTDAGILGAAAVGLMG